MQIVEVYYKRKVDCDFAAIKQRAQEILQNEVDSSDPLQAEKAFVIFHKNFTLEYSDGRMPAQTAILGSHDKANLKGQEEAIQQSWRCRNTTDLLRDTKETRIVSELMARNLPAKDRICLFHGVLQAMVELTEPDALLFAHSQQVIAPSDYLSSTSQDPILRPGSLNVRFYNITNSEGDMIMDTRGMEELGLHDLQCHYRKLDPNKVGRVLLNTAVYIFQNGPVIKSGETVAGIDPESEWRCQFEKSLLEPKREVLDLDPGKPYAAGKR
jgi:hypothetical protein